jgi:hypothetical protein
VVKGLLSTVECFYCDHTSIHLLNDKENDIGSGAQQFLSILQLPAKSNPPMSHLSTYVPFSGTTWAIAI